jgi:multiple sugar transport system permease protein
MGFLAAYVAVITFIMFPLVWIVMMSFKGYADVIAFPPTFIFTPTLENYSGSSQMWWE